MAIYFVQCGAGGPIKIGFSDNPAFRMSQLQTCHWQELTLLGTQDGTEEDERALHQRFSSARAGREWFWPVAELMAHIAMHTSKPPTTQEQYAHTVDELRNSLDTARLVAPSDIEVAARARGMTMKDVCNKSGIAMSIFTRWRAGTNSPRLATYEKLVGAAFGKTADAASTQDAA